MADQKITALTANTTPSSEDLIVMVNDPSGTPSTEKMTLQTLLSGWTRYVGVTPTHDTASQADDPTYPITFAGVDLTGLISVGMKVKITQTTDKFFIVTKIAFSTDTVVTLYGGTDYDLVDTDTTAISAFYYSSFKAPLAFPLDATKWEVTTTDSNLQSQSSPTAGTWYNVGTTTIVVPIGAWDVWYKVVAYCDRGSNGSASVATTLSTANNSESSDVWTARSAGTAAMDTVLGTHCVRNSLVIATKATYYLNAAAESDTGSGSIGYQGASGATVIKARCAYL